MLLTEVGYHILVLIKSDSKIMKAGGEQNMCRDTSPHLQYFESYEEKGSSSLFILYLRQKQTEKFNVVS